MSDDQHTRLAHRLFAAVTGSCNCGSRPRSDGEPLTTPGAGWATRRGREGPGAAADARPLAAYDFWYVALVCAVAWQFAAMLRERWPVNAWASLRSRGWAALDALG